jgi:hypothetical protein
MRSPVRQRRKQWLFLLQLFLFSIAISGDASKIILDESDEEQHELSFTEISKLRAREIKRRLVRKHGYTSEEVAQMIDKKILIETLAYEEHLRLQKRNSDKQRRRLQKSIVIALFTVAVILFWPLIQMAIRQLYEIVSVNSIIYTGQSIVHTHLNSLPFYFGRFLPHMAAFYYQLQMISPLAQIESSMNFAGVKISIATPVLSVSVL